MKSEEVKTEIRKILEKYTFIDVNRIENGKVLRLPSLVQGTGTFNFDPKKHACIDYPYSEWIKMINDLEQLFIKQNKKE